MIRELVQIAELMREAGELLSDIPHHFDRAQELQGWRWPMADELHGASMLLKDMVTPGSMDSAPKDGTRILIETRAHGWTEHSRRLNDEGTRWVECRWVEHSPGKGSFIEWLGNKRMKSFGSGEYVGIYPIRWMPLPQGTLHEREGP